MEQHGNYAGRAPLGGAHGVEFVVADAADDAQCTHPIDGLPGVSADGTVVLKGLNAGNIHLGYAQNIGKVLPFS